MFEMQTIESAVLIVTFIILELIIFHNFYNSRQGKQAVYNTWYAWIIDVLAMFSGVSIMGLSVFSLYNPLIFNFPVPGYLFILLFIFGSWQFSIHFIKLIIRNIKVIIVKKKHKKPGEETLKEFEKEYNKAVENYYEKIDKEK